MKAIRRVRPPNIPRRKIGRIFKFYHYQGHTEQVELHILRAPSCTVTVWLTSAGALRATSANTMSAKPYSHCGTLIRTFVPMLQSATLAIDRHLASLVQTDMDAGSGCSILC